MSNISIYQNLGQLKNLNSLPKHITLEQKNELIEEITKYHESKKSNKKRKFYTDRDTLMIEFLWVTGGRIGDICNLEINRIDSNKKRVTLYVKKIDQDLIVPLDSDTLLKLEMFIRNYQLENTTFKMTPTNAWYNVKKYGRLIGMELHPHMFRHGLALHLLNKGVPIPYISARLGHKSVKTTIDCYMKVTPEMQAKFLPLINEV